MARNAVIILVLVAPGDLTAQVFSPRPSNSSPQAVYSGSDPAWPDPVTGVAGAPRETAAGVNPACFDSPADGDSDLNLQGRPLPSPPVGNADERTVASPTSWELPKLSPPHDASDGKGGSGKRLGVVPSLLTIGSSLAIVLGLFFLFAWTWRRATPGGTALLPSEVLEVLGRTNLTHRQNLHLLRCGGKLLLIHVSPDSVQAVAEITEPVEVDRILGLCRQLHPQSTSAAFRQVFQQFASERIRPGFLPRSAREELGEIDVGGQGTACRGRERTDD
ncbi:MAG: hypothetical protein GXY83_31730 [Rhodopirellula sp.]|nr:hypothetical protein [Rhodopirellula sp.]